MKDILKSGLILMLYSLVAGSALAFVYLKTLPVIEERKAALARAILLEVLPGMDGGYVPQGDADSFGYWAAYKGDDKSEADGYVFTAKGKGYSSTIETMVGVDKDGKVTGLKVVFQQETPGLGDKILEIKSGESDPWYLRQFIGKSSADNIMVADDGGIIDAISGATVSSRAVAGSVLNGLLQLNATLTGGEFVAVEIPDEIAPADMPLTLPEEGDFLELLPRMMGGYEINEDEDAFPYWTAYEDEDQTEVGGYLFVARKEGYSHNIDTLVAVDTEGAITDVKILFHKETADYGGKMEEVRDGEDAPWFLVQFADKSADDNVALAADGGTIDAITDATISSETFTKSINSGLNNLAALLSGGEYVPDEDEEEYEDEDDELAFLFGDDEEDVEDDEEIGFLFDDDDDDEASDEDDEDAGEEHSSDEDAEEHSDDDDSEHEHAEEHAAPAMEPLDPDDTLSELFSDREYELLDDNGFSYYAAYGDVAKIEVLGYAFIASGTGDSDEIRTLVAVDQDFVIESLKVLYHHERGDLPGFAAQFKGKAQNALELKADGGKIDPMSGAAAISKAVTESVASGLNKLKNIVQ